MATASPGTGVDTEGASTDLRAFVPRGPLNWLSDEPERRHRRVDGSLVFVDISGFTAMSERLARLGRVGAEEVTDLLNQTFSRLLAVAYEDDASLMKFGGDALLLQFTGGEHALRAVHAAWGMRRKLRELQPLQSSAGQVRLRMSVGVHSGPIDMFLVGSSHRELMLVGPGASTVVAMEGAAGPGQIMVSQGVVDILGDQVKVAAHGDGYRLRGDTSVPTTTPQPDTKGDTGGLAERLLPPAVRDRLAIGVPTAEHRVCVTAFVKFSGTDELLADQGPEATAQVLDDLVRLLDDAVAPDGVCLLSSDVDANGGKFILTAGVPTATEHDGERMLRALRRVVDAGPPLPLKIGVHAGPVFAGVVGPWFRLTYTIIGDAVNLAARVMGRADPGTVLATPEVLNRSQSLFATRELPPFEVKGKSQPVRAHEIGAVTTQRARETSTRFPLAGRREELRLLLEEFDLAATGTGRTVQLVGPAGLGKSRLVDEVHERRPQAPLIVATCSRYESTTTYHAIGQVLRRVLDLTPRAAADDLATAVAQRVDGLLPMLPLIGDAVGIEVPDTAETRDLTAAFRSRRVVGVLGELFAGVLRDPAILVVEDVHFIDPESARVLDGLRQRVLDRRPWLVLLTARRQVVAGDSLDADVGTVIELGPLTEQEAREFVYTAVEDGLVSLERGQQLLDRAGGNPFFLQELLRRSGEDGALPDSVEALMQADLDQLPIEDREVLGHAAVLGEEIDPDLFAAVSGIDVAAQAEVWRRLDGFIEPAGPGTFRFRHGLLHDAAYARLPFRRRRDLHQQAAAALESSPDPRPDLLALHTYHARDWPRARRYALAAAERASSRFAHLTAVEHYRHAIESGRYVRGLDDRDLARTWRGLGDALMHASAYEDAVAAFRRAKAVATPSEQVHLCTRIGQVRERQGQYSQALAWFTRGRTLDSDAGTGEAARLLVESAIVRIRQGRPHDALALADEAAATTDVQVAARVSYVRAWSRMLLGVDGRDDEQRTLELFRDAGDLIGEGLAYNVISMAAYYRGEWDAATHAYERARELRRRVGDEVAAAVASGNLGELLADQGHYDRARPLLEEARAVCAAAGYPAGQHFATMTLGRLAAREGHFDEASERLESALSQLEALRAAALVRDVHARLGELAVFRRDLDRALREADLVDAATGLGTASLRATGQRLRTCVAALRGAPGPALQAGEDLMARLGDGDVDYDTALSLVAAARAFDVAGDPRAAEVRATAAGALDHLGVVRPAEELVFGPGGLR